MKQPRAVIKIKHQSLTTPQFINDNTLVDDPVALVDDPVALSAGPVSIYPGLRANAPPKRYFTKLKKRR